MSNRLVVEFFENDSTISIAEKNRKINPSVGFFLLTKYPSGVYNGNTPKGYEHSNLIRRLFGI
jgi:hypothetical protein